MANNDVPEFSDGQIVWYQPNTGPSRLSRVVKIKTTKKTYRDFTSWRHHYTLQPVLAFPHDADLLPKKSHGVAEYNITEVGDITDLCHVHSRLGSIIREVAEQRGLKETSDAPPEPEAGSDQ